MDGKTFPLRVNQEWLDRVDEARKRNQSKHEYIIQAVDEKIKRDKELNENGA